MNDDRLNVIQAVNNVEAADIGDQVDDENNVVGVVQEQDPEELEAEGLQNLLFFVARGGPQGEQARNGRAVRGRGGRGEARAERGGRGRGGRGVGRRGGRGGEARAERGGRGRGRRGGEGEGEGVGRRGARAERRGRGRGGRGEGRGRGGRGVRGRRGEGRAEGGAEREDGRREGVAVVEAELPERIEIFDDWEIPVAEEVEIDDGDEMAEEGNDGLIELEDGVGGEVAILMAIEANNVDVRVAAEGAEARRQADQQLLELWRQHIPNGVRPMVVRARVGGPWGDGRQLLENDYGIDRERRRRDPPLDEEIPDEMPLLPFQLPKDARDSL